ncbi:uncharacterized protein LOC144666512 [Oculina patagonica]
MEKTKNGNMVVKEFLENKGVQLSRFNHFRSVKPAARRKLRRMQGGEISVPVQQTNSEIRETLMSKIESGEYILGEMIVPQTFKKVTLTKEGKIKTETFTVTGRKIPLLDIRKNMLKEHEAMGLMRIRSDSDYDLMTEDEISSRLKQLGEDEKEESASNRKEKLKEIERKRHLMVWSDNATLLNHGHILLTVNAVYDEALYFTNEEMKGMGQENVDVQNLVERPHVYILGRCGSSEVEQLAYINTRKACLQTLDAKVTTSGGIQISDTMRFFHGDGPQQQFEAGEQKGGHAGCASCSGDSRKYKHLAVSLNRPHLSLQERKKKVLQGPAGRQKRNGGIKPFKDLLLEELKRECSARGLPCDGQKDELQEVLKEELGGIQRVPAMIFFDQSKHMADLGLGNYEVLPTEPLHDIKEHIANVLTELPCHLEKEEKKALEEIIEYSSGGKEKKRGCDYRLAAVIVAQYLRGKVRPLVQSLLDSLTELSKLLYMPAHSRCPKLVLRLHNQAFIHAMTCKEIIGKPKILTERKFYGRYWHSLTAHAAKQSRIVSLKSTNTEEEERHFNTLQGVTKLTNRRPGDIITPSLIRLQAEQKLAESSNPVKMQESKISKYYNTLPPLPSTVIPNRYIIKHPKEYQAHLQGISDFIAGGEGVWWQQILSGVEFFDGPNEANSRPRGPLLHHFRSSNLQLEEEYLQECWDMCLIDENITIPHSTIRIYNQRGDCTRVTRTNFLYRDDDSDEELGNEAEDAETESLVVDDDEDAAEEVTLLEEVITPEFKDFSGEYSDDENDEEELQPLFTSPSLSAVANNSTLKNSEQDKSSTDNYSSRRPIQNLTTSQQSRKSLSDNGRPSSDNSQRKKIQTKLCKNIAKIVGETENVYKLDTARQNMKQHPTSTFHTNNFQNLLAPMQTQNLAHHTSLKKQHKEWEKQYFLQNDCAEASLEDLKTDNEQYSIYKKLVLCEELFKHWKITVHL